MFSFHFLAGQCSVGLWLLLPWDGRGWLLLLPAVFFLRGWGWLAFAAGGLWQKFWASGGGGVAHPFFWFLGSAESLQDPLPIFFQGGPLDRFAGLAARRLQDFFLEWDPAWGAWFLRFGFGFKIQGGDGWPGIYQQLGLLHVLVVSGSHFTFAGALCRALMEGPGRIAYALRLLPFSAWLGWVTVSRIGATALLSLLALVVGFQPPCQRAWLSLLLGLWLPLIGSPLRDAASDRWVFSLQAFLFPNSFLSLSNALSWSAYCMVRYLKPWPRPWQRRLLPAVEGPLIAVNLSYFGTFSPWGLILNTLLQPVWHMILILGLLFWVWPDQRIGEWLREILQLLHEGILFVHAHGQRNGPIRWEARGAWADWGRGLLWIAASWMFFRLWRRREDAC